MSSDTIRKKIAFLTSCDATNKHAWSGTDYYMAKALEKHIGDVYFLGPASIEEKKLNKTYKEISEALPNKKYNYWHSIALSLEYANIFEQKLQGKNFDIIFAPASSTEIAFLETNIPIVYSSDTTFSLIKDYYYQYANLADISIIEGNIIEKLAIEKSKFIIYPSQWAAKSAINDYGADEAKILIAPYGANLDSLPEREVILGKKKSKVCRLLFVGVDWERKGGEIAFETLMHLEKMGVPATLTVCGCTPPSKFSSKNMKVIPFINKNTADGLQQFYNLYLNSDFFIVPSRAECLGIVFGEASAFGVPSIAADTGGISGMVRNCINGFMLPLSARGYEYAKVIFNVFNSDKAYDTLVRSSRDIFEKELNWDSWAATVNNFINRSL